MIGRLLRTIPARVGTSLSRVETVRALLKFWATHGADWMPFQEQLERYVAHNAKFHFDERVVQKILTCLVEAKILHRVLVPPRTVQYRLDRQFADPTWPGFAREIDDLLRDPLTWPAADGRLFKVGIREPNSPYPSAYLVPARPHYFATHTWARAWLHAFHLGFLNNDATIGIEVVRRAARDAPLTALRILYAGPDDALTRAAKGLIEQTRLYRAFATLFSRSPLSPIPRDRLGPAGAAFSEAALESLHTLCGHAPFEPPDRPRGGRPTKRPAPEGRHRVVRERFVYEALDVATIVNLRIHEPRLDDATRRRSKEFWESTVEAWSRVPIRAPGEERLAYASFDVPVGVVAPQIRTSSPALRRTMGSSPQTNPQSLGELLEP